MRIATWNVNSIKVRLPRVLEWLDSARPDVVCLQEIKCEDDKFPAEAIEDVSYNVAVHGQKTYNGVALLARRPIEDVVRGLPGADDDDQSRYIEATVDGVRVGCIYLPNGNPYPGPKFDYKLAWMDRLIEHAKALLELEETFVLAGDYNVCPTADDLYDPEGWADDALFRIESRHRWRQLLNLGLTDAVRAFNPQPHYFTFWDYQGGAWQKDNGLRIDHLLVSPQAADRLIAGGVDKEPRGKEKASDHTPAWIELRE